MIRSWHCGQNNRDTLYGANANAGAVPRNFMRLSFLVAHRAQTSPRCASIYCVFGVNKAQERKLNEFLRLRCVATNRPAGARRHRHSALVVDRAALEDNIARMAAIGPQTTLHCVPTPRPTLAWSRCIAVARHAPSGYREFRHCGRFDLTGTTFVATITPRLSRSEAGVGVGNLGLRAANVEVAADSTARHGPIGSLYTLGISAFRKVPGRTIVVRATSAAAVPLMQCSAIA